MRRPILAGIGVLLMCVATLATPLAAASEYDVTTDQSIDVPDRTVEQGGDTFTISEISRADSGDSISVTAEAPSNTDINLYLYNNDQAIIDDREGTGTNTFEFTLENDSGAGYESGTYAFVLQHDGSRKAVHPLVIRGYSVSVDAPSSVTKGDDVSISADISKLQGEDKQSVEIVVANDATTIRKTASKENSGTYTTTVDTDDLSTGTYDVYANVRGSEQALGQKELLGLSDPQTLQIESKDQQKTEGQGTIAGAVGTSTSTGGTETASDTTPTNPQDQQPQNIAESVTQGIVDEVPQTSGVTVRIKTETLTTITFSDESVQAAGDLTVSRYSKPPNAFAQQFEESNVLTSVNIEVPPAAEDTPATLEFRISEAALGDRPPESLGIVRVVDGGLQLIPTEVESTDGGIVVRGETPGFSKFAVVSIEKSGANTTSASDSTAAENGAITPNTQTTDGTATTGVGSTHLIEVIMAAVMLVTLGARWRRN